MRTFHEAKPVKRGVKHAANLWLHQHDFRAAHVNGCWRVMAVEVAP